MLVVLMTMGRHGVVVRSDDVVVVERLVGGGVDAPLPELLLDARVPEVFDLVVRPPRQAARDRRPSVYTWSEHNVIS